MNNNTHNYVYMKFLIIIIIKSEHHPGPNYNEYTPKQHRREHPVISAFSFEMSKPPQSTTSRNTCHLLQNMQNQY